MPGVFVADAEMVPEVVVWPPLCAIETGIGAACVPRRLPEESAMVMTCWSALAVPKAVSTRMGVPVPAVIATEESAMGLVLPKSCSA